jgi:hypothetical protein
MESPFTIGNLPRFPGIRKTNANPQYTQKGSEGAIKLKTFFEKHAPLDSVTAKRYNNGSITPNKFRGDACFEQ